MTEKQTEGVLVLIVVSFLFFSLSCTHTQTHTLLLLRSECGWFLNHPAMNHNISLSFSPRPRIPCSSWVCSSPRCPTDLWVERSPLLQPLSIPSNTSSPLVRFCECTSGFWIGNVRRCQSTYRKPPCLLPSNRELNVLSSVANFLFYIWSRSSFTSFQCFLFAKFFSLSC